MQVLAAFETDDTGGVVLEDLLHGGTEMVVQRCPFPYADVLPAFLVELIDLGLQDDTHALHEEDPAEDGYQQLLVDDHGADADDATDGEAAGVTEEDLCGEAVEPEVAHQSADERGEEDYQLFGARDVHDIEILRPDDTTGGVGENEQGNRHDGRVTGTHAVHAVVEVRTVADCRYYEDCQQHKEDPTEAVFIVLARPGEEVGIIEVMMLDEGDGGLGGLDLRTLLDDDHIVLDMTCDDLVHSDSRAETKGESDDETEGDLTGDLDPTVQTLFVLAEGLDIIVRKAQRAHEKGRYQHEDHIDVAQLAEQQTGQQDGYDDDDTAHRRHAFLAHVEGIGFLIALGLRDMMAFHEIDEPVTETDTGDECDDARYDGAEGDVGEQARTEYITEIGKKMINHFYNV